MDAMSYVSNEISQIPGVIDTFHTKTWQAMANGAL